MDADRRGQFLFRRDFRRPTGGHLKVWHYFGHAEGATALRPEVYLTPTSRRGPLNPFDAAPPGRIVPEWRPREAAALFVAGLDWEAVPEEIEVPVVNLVQGVRHADPGDPRREFLGRRAVRICVSPEVADAIRGTGLVNGPVVTIPNGVDLAVSAPNEEERRVPLLLVGWKEPERTREVARLLEGKGVRPDVVEARIPRDLFLRRLAEARTVVFLPLDREGCFLPALEAFALGCLVVCPDCVGNRGFCRDGETCLVPAGDPGAIATAALAAAALPEEVRRRMTTAAAGELATRGLAEERRAFLDLLAEIAEAGT